MVLSHHDRIWLKNFSADMLRYLPLTEFMKQALELADPTLFGAAPPSASTADQPGEGGNYGARVVDYAAILKKAVRSHFGSSS